ncbi:MAG: DUF4232 domain-containing protein [Kocuria sp.]|nr:DUF4232 domain-containing protein [Kocuria sp.]
MNIDDAGGLLGDSCDATAADGWRLYPPGSKTSVYVEQDGLKACVNKDVPWLTVPEHPVDVIAWILHWCEYAKMK